MSHKNNMVENIGLRGSHFNLGNNNPNPYVTTNSTSFNNQPKQRQMPNIKQQDAHGASEHDKANLRASHFNLGGQDPKGYYFTTNSTTLKHHQDATRAVLSEEQKKDLRTHHFKMGQYAPTTQTINNITYDKKNLVEMKDQEKLKQFMRGHHHNFREMPNTVMTTKYNDDYNKEIEKAALKQGITADQMREKALSLRHSHIVLGKEHPNFQSVQQKDFTQKNNQYKPQTKDLQSSHFQLGNQKDAMCTTNDVFHNQQPIVTNPLVQETKNDLRASHFKMGQEGLTYQTEFSGNYQQQSDNRQNSNISTAQLQSNHFNIGDPRSKSTFQTVYSQTMKKPLQSSQLDNIRDQKQDRGSNFTIGNQGTSFTSEFSANFKTQNGKPSSLNDQQKANLRSHHFQFNDVKNNTYQTQYRNNFQHKNTQNAKGKLEDSLLQDLRQQHFNLGQQKTDYTSTSHKTHHHPGNVQPGVLNDQQKADLRTHHFKLG